VPAPEATSYTIFGASWCRFCRRSEAVLEFENIPFKWIDMDKCGGPSHAREYLQKNHGLPETHTTIPCVFFEGKFIGGYTALVDRLKLEGKATDAILKQAEEKASGASVDFQKGVTTAHLSFSGDEFDTTNEYVVAKKDGATMRIQFNVIGVTETDTVQLYLITEVPHDEKITASRTEQLAPLTNDLPELQKPLAIFGKSGMIVAGKDIPVDPNNFHAKQVQIKAAQEHNVKLTYPGRHLGASFVPVVSKYEVTMDADSTLTFEAGTRIYTVYLTTEKPK